MSCWHILICSNVCKLNLCQHQWRSHVGAIEGSGPPLPPWISEEAHIISSPNRPAQQIRRQQHPTLGTCMPQFSARPSYPAAFCVCERRVAESVPQPVTGEAWTAGREPAASVSSVSHTTVFYSSASALCCSTCYRLTAIHTCMQYVWFLIDCPFFCF